MINIGTNRKSLSFRILILLVLWSFFFYFYYRIVREPEDSSYLLNVIGIGLAALYYTPLFIITTLFRPIRVTITPDSLVFFKMLTGPQTLTFPEIQSFSTQSFHTLNGRLEGVTIIHSGNKKLKVAELNVETIQPLIKALQENNIGYSGHRDKQARSFKQQR